MNHPAADHLRPRRARKSAIIICAIVIAALSVGGGCARRDSSGSDAARVPRQDQNSPVLGAQQEDHFADGIERVRVPVSTSTGGTVEAYRFDPEKFRFGIAATSARLDIGTWAAENPSASAIINGGYFMEDGTPSGFLSIKGTRVGTGAFDADKSAVVDVADRVRIVSASATDIDPSHFKTALQTYPWLMKNGAPAVREDSGKLARRSFIGTDRTGGVWIGVVADAEVSLFALAQRLAGMGIDWDAVANLDGGPSTGLAVGSGPDRVIRETFGGVPNVIYAVRVK